MNRNHNKLSGFSLTEMLIATGIMAIGLVMVATIFPVGVKLTSLTTERTLGAVAADEAFAKIQLYGLRDFVNWPAAIINTPGYANPADATYEFCDDFQYATDYAGPDGVWGTFDDNYMQPGPDGTWGNGDDISWDSEFLYPSAAVSTGQDRNYHWSALCRRTGAKEVQVTVFVTRKIGAASQYHAWDYNVGTFTPITNSQWPKPVKIEVRYNPANLKELVLDFTDPINAAWGGVLPANPERVLSFFDDGYTIVDDYFGNIYRILEVDRINKKLILQQNWKPTPNSPNEAIWVVPPAVGSDRYPCVGVYQKSIYFEDIN